ncbi:MAG: sigma-54-dependent Fis family transcriptional regulator [Candidatus Abyssobacteria bacterium SURF_17]|uniref:Sigma-54-dependent Fis family transcriptional regulator n=1 Tax=Candidatus Abyssobacteria bacterium SURF_17 TaxID=2093361 RepID=A0A419EY94_9BACT|nr:MAG: sigma-54-dependent Fis family transcriptional regulator [Candidatus Abyssubacteria bacterium SURF_17]
MLDSKILLVDDEKSARYGMRRALASLGGKVIEAANGREALGIAEKEEPDLIIMDIAMPEMTGFEALEKLCQMPSPPLIIMITAHGSEKVAVEAMKRGAYDYIAKPYEVDELRMVARNALEKISLERENRRLAEELKKKESYGEIIGASDVMQEVFDRIGKVSQTDVAVLIEGESGTGKELVANEIHKRSHRSGGPFVIMNCAALPENLIESELFGHEKGAFTGATAQRRGKFEIADGGTLFLDEIGDMSLNTQAKVLRVLQEQRFERLGGEKTIQVDVRIISATNKDLAAATKAGAFREDLYYRLKVVSISLPPLRERKGDIALLTNSFVEMFSRKHRKRILGIDAGAMRVIHDYPWPGNVRELSNAIESAVVLAGGNTLRRDDLPPEIRKQAVGAFGDPFSIDATLPFREWKKQMVETAERLYLIRKLEENDHNISQTARALDMHRQSLQQKLRELGIDVKDLQEE